MAAEDYNAADLRRVYDAVVGGEGAEEISQLLDEVSRGSRSRRSLAVNVIGENEDGEQETTLQAAVRLSHDEDVLRLLVKPGASLEGLQGGGDRVTTLALCIAFKTPDDVRALLRQGGHDVNQRYPSGWRYGSSNASSFMTAAHECVEARKLDCLEVLVREGGADVNSRDSGNSTPLHELVRSAHIYDDPVAALDVLISLGADLEARDNGGYSALFYSTALGEGRMDDRIGARMLRALLARGASADVVSSMFGDTPLLFAAHYNRGPDRAEVIAALVEHSSEATRRVLCYGCSSIDCIVGHQPDNQPFQPWHFRVVAELRRSGVTIQPEYAARLLPEAARRGNQVEAELAARRSPSRRWRAHDEFVQLAFDYRDRREADEALAATEAHLAALEGPVGQRLVAMADRVAELEARLGQIVGRVEELEERLGERDAGAAPAAGGAASVSAAAPSPAATIDAPPLFVE